MQRRTVRSCRVSDIEAIYREQYGSLVGFVAARVRDRARAEEIVQEAFLRALDSQPANPRAWLYTVAANLVRDQARHGEVRRRQLHLVADERTVAPPDVELEGRERQQAIRAALEAIGERDHRALMLQQSGSSYDDIAAELGLSRGSVGTTLARARRRFVAAWRRHTAGGEEP